MGKNIPLSTIGVKISWAVETTAGERPTSGYNIIHGISSTPDLNTAPNTVDGTSFDDVKFTRSIPVLSDISGAMEYGVQYGVGFKKDWDALMTAYKTAKSSGKEIWFCEDIPNDLEDENFNNAYFYTVTPIEFKKPTLNANDGIPATAYAVFTGSYVEAKSPQYTPEA